MSKKSLLQGILETVATGGVVQAVDAADIWPTIDEGLPWQDICRASQKSLDAAQNAHRHNLKDWVVHIGTENNGEFHVIVGSTKNGKWYAEAFHADMAVAWLIAILTAMIEFEAQI